MNVKIGDRIKLEGTVREYITFTEPMGFTQLHIRLDGGKEDIIIDENELSCAIITPREIDDYYESLTTEQLCSGYLESYSNEYKSCGYYVQHFALREAIRRLRMMEEENKNQKND